MSAHQSDDSNERLVERCREVDNTASRILFDRYSQRLMGVARQHIGERMKSRFDAEDVVQSVFRTFFTRLKKDLFEINDGDDLSRLLVRITLNKTLRQVADHRSGLNRVERTMLFSGSLLIAATTYRTCWIKMQRACQVSPNPPTPFPKKEGGAREDQSLPQVCFVNRAAQRSALRENCPM